MNKVRHNNCSENGRERKGQNRGAKVTITAAENGGERKGRNWGEKPTFVSKLRQQRKIGEKQKDKIGDKITGEPRERAEWEQSNKTSNKDKRKQKQLR